MGLCYYSHGVHLHRPAEGVMESLHSMVVELVRTYS